MRPERLRQNVHAERRADQAQAHPQRPQAVPVRPLRQKVRPEGPPEEAREDARAAAAGDARGARHAALRGLGGHRGLPLRAHVHLLKFRNAWGKWPCRYCKYYWGVCGVVCNKCFIFWKQVFRFLFLWEDIIEFAFLFTAYFTPQQVKL